MGITTKKGDNGKTSILTGKRISKDHIIIEAIGSIDELCSFLNIAKSLARKKILRETLAAIQNDLLIICSEISEAAKPSSKLKKHISDKHIFFLEKAAAGFEKRTKIKLKCFCLLGDSTLSAYLDAARSIARRCERRIVTLKNKKMLANRNILIYMNRLSDLLFLLAVKEDKKTQNRRKRKK